MARFRPRRQIERSYSMVVTQGLQVWARQWHVQLLGSSGACNGVFVKEFVVADLGRVFQGGWGCCGVGMAVAGNPSWDSPPQGVVERSPLRSSCPHVSEAPHSRAHFSERFLRATRKTPPARRTSATPPMVMRSWPSAPVSGRVGTFVFVFSIFNVTVL